MVFPGWVLSCLRRRLLLCSSHAQQSAWHRPALTEHLGSAQMGAGSSVEGAGSPGTFLPSPLSLSSPSLRILGQPYPEGKSDSLPRPGPVSGWGRAGPQGSGGKEGRRARAGKRREPASPARWRSPENTSSPARSIPTGFVRHRRGGETSGAGASAGSLSSGLGRAWPSSAGAPAAPPDPPAWEPLQANAEASDEPAQRPAKPSYF